MRVLMIGGTGLVGTMLSERLLERGDELIAIQRRPSGRYHPRLSEEIAEIEAWPEVAAGQSADVAVSMLGTTMRKAGSEAAFRAVDLEAVVAFAAAARGAGVRRMATVSSVGADPRSRNFYLRTKGEMEEALAGMDFDRLDIFRPGLLRGERGSDRRLGERIGIVISPLVNRLLVGGLQRYAAIDAVKVAEAIAASGAKDAPGRFVHENRDIARLAG